MIYFEAIFQLTIDITNYLIIITTTYEWERKKLIHGFKNLSNKVHAPLQKQTFKKFKIFESKLVRRKVYKSHFAINK